MVTLTHSHNEHGMNRTPKLRWRLLLQQLEVKHYRPKQYLTQRTSAGAAPQRLKAWSGLFRRVKLKNESERQTKIREAESGQKKKYKHSLNGREGSVV